MFDSSGIRDKAEVVAAGGEVINNYTPRHTKTHMGSGEFASEGWRQSAYQRLISYVNTNYQYVNLKYPNIHISEDSCYDLEFFGSSGTWQSYFYYGGPGYDGDDCT